MIGTSEKGKLDGLSPQRRYLERTRKYRADQRALQRRHGAPKPEVPASDIPDRPEKGHCRHCGEHIGRGIAFHERKCPASRI